MESKFLWLGNWSALDFVNTKIVVLGKPVDLLPDCESLLRWLQEANLKSASPRASDKTRAFKIATEYREFLRNGVAALVKGSRLPDVVLAETNRYLAAPENAMRVVMRAGAYCLVSEPRAGTPNAYAVPIAQSFAKLLTEADLRRLRKCANPDCVLFFYDTSKSGTRTWCSLDLCGNKLRMAASRQRRESSPKKV